MGVKTLSQFKAELKLELGQRGDIESIGGVDYRETWVNSAYMTLTTQNKLWNVRKNFYFPELETYGTAATVDGTATVSTPTDCMVIRHVWDSTNDTKLTRISFAEYIQMSGRATSTSEGKPTRYVRNGDYIYLYPTPDAAYTLYVYYRKRPATMSADADVTEIGAEWDEPILRIAKVLALRKLSQYDEAKKEQEYAEDMIRGVVGIYDQENFDKQDYRKVDDVYSNQEY
jgi:hypothetical protein